MSKSSLKTFLAGKNERRLGSSTLHGALALEFCVEDQDAYSTFWNPNGMIDYRWLIDVLDDGTAITYCAAP
jgi:hypothetical protein